MDFIFVSGIWSNQNPIWSNMHRACRAAFPEARFSLAEKKDLQPWELLRMRSLIDEIVRKADRGAGCILIGHSLGGVIACACALRMAKARIRGIVTICSPHTYLGSLYPILLGAIGELSVPLLSYGALRDEVLWWGLGTEHPQSLEHHVLDMDHYLDFMRDPVYAERIVRDARRHFLKDA